MQKAIKLIMKTVTSVSGGKTSAYLAANYPTDYNVFSLVRIEDRNCLFPDRKIRQLVEDRIQKPFIATAEDDMIVYTILDLEQYLGREIKWVSGITFDELIATKGGWLPNKLHRYCTSRLKLEPIFQWWAETIGDPVIMNIGFRANEGSRALRMMEKLNENGLLTMKTTFEKLDDGRNKWETVEWQKPAFPLLENGIYRDAIVQFWGDKPVRFAVKNNCVHCFHQNPLLIRKRTEFHRSKMEWAAGQEGGDNGYWRNDGSYADFINNPLQFELQLSDFSECDSGYCEL